MKANQVKFSTVGEIPAKCTPTVLTQIIMDGTRPPDSLYVATVFLSNLDGSYLVLELVELWGMKLC